MRPLVLFAFALVGCAAEPAAYVPAEDPEPIPLTFFVSGIAPEVVEDACAVWAPEGVECSAAAAETDDADLRVYATIADCDDAVLARYDSGHEGLIKVYVECFGEDELVAVVAHEIGHALGVAHVDEDEPALMNLYGTDIAFMMVADHLAFLDRDTHNSVDITAF